MEELSRQFKAGEINANQLKEAVRELAKGYGKDIGVDFEVVYLDEKTMPKDSEGSTGSSYILDKKNRNKNQWKENKRKKCIKYKK